MTIALSCTKYLDMNSCPSRAVERYLASMDIPEDCPVCGEPNADDNGVPYFSEDEAFCGAQCRDTYVAEQKAADAAYAQSIAEDERIVADYNANCPRCVGSLKLCTHQN